MLETVLDSEQRIQQTHDLVARQSHPESQEDAG